MENVICCMAGHSIIYEENIKQMIYECAKELIEFAGVNEFWVGNYGEFDRISAHIIRNLKGKYDIKLCLVLPYITREIEIYKQWYDNNFDKVIIADLRADVPEKYKIIEANRYMVDNSDFLLCYVKYAGGAEKTLKYAQSKKKHIINLA